MRQPIFHADRTRTANRGAGPGWTASGGPGAGGRAATWEDAMTMARRGMMCVPLFLVLLALGGGSSGCGAGGSSRDRSGPSVPSAPGWESRDIGLVGSPGATGPSGKGFAVSASGADIWGGADQFRFVYQPLLGDGTITACVESLTHSDDWAKAGVMIRESLFPDSAFAMAVTTPSNGVDLQYRTSTAGGAGMASAVSGAAPVWVSLARSGSTFTAQMSSDGSTWTPLGSISIPMRANVYIGLAVTAHTNLAQTTAVFDPVSVTGAAALPATVVFGNLQPVPFSQVVLSDPFWAPRIETNRTASLPMMYQSFISNGNLDNFPKAAGLMSGDHNGFLWADSDVYKTLEGMSRAIGARPRRLDRRGRLRSRRLLVRQGVPVDGHADRPLRLVLCPAPPRPGQEEELRTARRGASDDLPRRRTDEGAHQCPRQVDQGGGDLQRLPGAGAAALHELPGQERNPLGLPQVQRHGQGHGRTGLPAPLLPLPRQGLREAPPLREVQGRLL